MLCVQRCAAATHSSYTDWLTASLALMLVAERLYTMTASSLLQSMHADSYSL
jgi:hypothetical protein